MVDDQEIEIVAKELRDSISGEVVTRDHPRYDEARKVWNGAIDRRPAVIAYCADTADVVEAVRVARHHPLEVAVRSGGHQVAGTGLVDDGLVIDLSLMQDVRVDAEDRIATVSAGARWHHVDRATQEHGLATTGGEVSITGVAGLTLGGGMGVLQRAYGLACDNLRAVEIVTADGVIRRASADEHPDLHWAARGAGRGLGVVTAFEFALHPLGPDVAVAFTIYPGADATQVLRGYRDLVADAPESVSPEVVLWCVPPDPEIPVELHFEPAVMVVAVHAGDPAEADPVLAPYRNLATPLLDLSGTMPYADLQASSDPLFPEGARYYFKAHFADDIDDDAVEAVVAAHASRPTPQSLIAIRSLGGAIDRVAPEESAYPHRGRRFNVSFDGAWTDPADDDRSVGWARSAFSSFEPFAAGGVYVNFAGFEGESDVSGADMFGNQSRLAEIRAAYDPDGVFAAAARRR
jgi:FAD/FMN-containing dehydrogenase